MRCLGIDIGGANLKISDRTTSISKPFALWKEPENLSQKLSELLKLYPEAIDLAVSMTGELADCFESRSVGVRFILDAVTSAAEGREVQVWTTTGEFLNPQQAADFPILVAAANWHALATWVGRVQPTGSTLLIDMGSTTTDIIPIENGIPLPTGRTDLERLCSGELIYTGSRRTPVCSLAQNVSIGGRESRVAAELFATTLDISLVRELLPDEPDNLETANSQPATRFHALRRLARMVCSDSDEISEHEIVGLADQFQYAQFQSIAAGVNQVLEAMGRSPEICILSGEGEFLIRNLIETQFPQVMDAEIISLNTLFGADHCRAACAYALSQLGEES